MKAIVFLIFSLVLSNISIAADAQLKVYKGDLQKPELVLKDLQGKRHKLKDYRGKVVLVQFWATYCTPCRVEMPSMNRMQKKLKTKPFKILAVNMAEEAAEVNAFVKEVRPEFTILLDTEGENINRWKVFAAPASFVIDKQGDIRFTLYGGVEWDSEVIIKKIEQLM